MSNVHDLIKEERRKRGIPAMYWSREMARLAQSQANYCAKVGHLVHSSRFAFQGGENLAQGGRNFSPRAIVNCWLNSKAGHREYLLSPKVTKAGVGIAKRGGNTFVAWAFSDASPTYPDCPKCKRRSKTNWLPKHNKYIGGRGVLRPVLGFVGLWIFLLGFHGAYVYFSLWETLFSAVRGSGESLERLFLVVNVPPPLSTSVSWMTAKGFESWFVPLIAILVGYWLMSSTRFLESLTNLARKLRLW